MSLRPNDAGSLAMLSMFASPLNSSPFPCAEKLHSTGNVKEGCRLFTLALPFINHKQTTDDHNNRGNHYDHDFDGVVFFSLMLPVLVKRALVFFDLVWLFVKLPMDQSLRFGSMQTALCKK